MGRVTSKKCMPYHINGNVTRMIFTAKFITKFVRYNLTLPALAELPRKVIFGTKGQNMFIRLVKKMWGNVNDLISLGWMKKWYTSA